MDFELISHTEQKARKEYKSDNIEYLTEWIGHGMYVNGVLLRGENGGRYTKEQSHVDFADLRKIVIARRERYKILVGTIYVKQVYKFEGDGPYVSRMRKDMYEIMCKYDLFGQD